jgi:hypothetical protein
VVPKYADLREAITKSKAPEGEKLSAVADIETVQSQLAKSQPSKGIISAAWAAIRGAAVVGEFVGLVDRVADHIAPLLQ